MYRLKRNKEVLILSSMIFLLTFLSVFVKNVELNNYYTFVALTPFMVMSAYYIYRNWKNIFENKIYLSWLVFLILVFISELQNGMILEAPILFAFTGVISIFDFDINRVSKSLIIGITPLFIVALIAVVLGNKFSSNTIGIIISFLFVSNQIYYLSMKKKGSLNKDKKTIIFLIAEVIVFFVLVKINSRTSLMISGISMALFVVHYIIKNKKIIINHYNNSNKYLRMAYIFCLVIACTIFVVFTMRVISSILTPKWRPNDISTGRFEIWKTTIENRQLFGHRYDWYTESGLFGPHKGPHNMIIGVLGFAGVVPMTVIVLVVVSSLWKLFSNYFSKKSDINAIFLIMFITSNLKGLTESLILQTSYQLYNIFFILPIVLSDPDSINNKEKIIFSKTLISFSIIFFFVVMLINIYGSVLNYNIENLLYIIKRYI